MLRAAQSLSRFACFAFSEMCLVFVLLMARLFSLKELCAPSTH